MKRGDVPLQTQHVLFLDGLLSFRSVIIAMPSVRNSPLIINTITDSSLGAPFSDSLFPPLFKHTLEL